MLNKRSPEENWVFLHTLFLQNETQIDQDDVSHVKTSQSANCLQMIILLVKCSQLIGTYRKFQSTIVYEHLLQQQSHFEHSGMSWRTFAWHCLIQGLPCSMLYNTNWPLGLEHLDKQVPLLANCNRYWGTYIHASIRSELHALLCEVACTNCSVLL